ncbi:MAG: tRNA (adenosine(37)-N6)-dimethylallyltransferase MiaA [Kiritimatiellia bacterium]
MNAAPPLKAFILGGATATGKTELCHRLARNQPGAAILSADSMLVYRGMDIGTAKPTPRQLAEIPYGGINLASPDQPFSAGLWLQHAKTFASQVRGPLFVTGGTGLYLRALTEGFNRPVPDEAVRARVRSLWEEGGIDAIRSRLPQSVVSLLDAPGNPRRLMRALEVVWSGGGERAFSGDKVAVRRGRFPVLSRPREVLHRRIQQRAEGMFSEGLLEEVRALRRRYPVWSETAGSAIGYAEAVAYLEGRLGLSEAIDRVAARTRQLARRQETWLRHQADAVWLEWGDESPEEMGRRVQEVWEQDGPVALA